MQLETLATCFYGSFTTVSLTVISVCDQLKVLQDATGYTFDTLDNFRGVARLMCQTLS